MKDNSFDFLRLLFSTFVIISHSYPLAGVSENDILSQLTSHQAALSHIGVSGFFIISGYMIYKSLVTSSSVWNYLFKRLVRIYPAYIVLILVTIFIVGPALSDLPYFEFISHPVTKSYFFLNINFFSPIQFNLPSVFNNNPYPNAVNGSLWTIPYEFLFYLIIISILVAPQKIRGYILLLSFLTLGGVLFKFGNHSLGVINSTSFEIIYLMRFGLMFMAGAVISEFKLIEKNTLSITLVSGILLLLVFQLKIFNYAQFLLLPPLILSLGYLKIPIIYKTRNFGDFSYGIYLYGFLVQQIIQHYFVLTPIPLMITSFSISLTLGYLSWNLVEKKALKFKSVL